MTAEIALMNRHGVALAADSAVTITTTDQQKVWESANKIFGLSRGHPVGVMIYGNADFMRLPWETIIKTYRDQLDETPFPALGDYADDFINFLESRRDLFPRDEQAHFAWEHILGYYERVREHIDEAIEREIENSGSIGDDEVMGITAAVVEAHQDVISEAEALARFPKESEDRLRRVYAPLIREAKKAVFQELPLSAPVSRRLTTCAVLALTRQLFPNGYSGVVIAGYGSDDYFPQLSSMACDGLVNGRLRFAMDDPCFINRESMAWIKPFAQQEMVYSFMEGVDREYQQLIEDVLAAVLREYPELVIDEIPGLSARKKTAVKKRLADFSSDRLKLLVDGLSSVRRDAYWYPVIQVVGVLPKDELASMAESLVNLTSFKRKVSLQAETVGGPIDVAVISKGDGFVWVKRKKYFQIEENPHVLARYLS